MAATAGQQLLVEEEVKRRMKEEKRREEFERQAKEKGGVDHDARALATFLELRERMEVNYENVTDDDALADAMLAADSLDKKKLLMRYKRLKQEVLQRDTAFTNKVLRNYFVCIRKVGTLYKKSEGFFNTWQERFVVLSNAGLIYFKVDQMKKEDDLQPQNFKPLNDFVLVEVPESVSPLLLPNDLECCYAGGEAAIHVQADLLQVGRGAPPDADERAERVRHARVDSRLPHAPDRYHGGAQQVLREEARAPRRQGSPCQRAHDVGLQRAAPGYPQAESHHERRCCPRQLSWPGRRHEQEQKRGREHAALFERDRSVGALFLRRRRGEAVNVALMPRPLRS